MKGKIWFITGISSGLGEALAQAVMEKGDFVVGSFRHQAQADAFNQKHRGKGLAVVLDITALGRIEPLVKEILDQFGKVDVLVNNAGVGFVGAIEETSLEETRKVFEANFFGTLELTRALLPSMRQQRSGHIIQISSHGGVKAFAGFGIYNASKFALEGFSEALAQEVAPLGIRLTLVEPGPFRTNFAGKSLGEAQAVISDYSETAGAFRNKLKAVDSKQEGHPAKAALAIIESVYSPNSTLRLPLGKVPTVTIKMKIDSLSADLERNRERAEQVVYS